VLNLEQGRVRAQQQDRNTPDVVSFHPFRQAQGLEFIERWVGLAIFMFSGVSPRNMMVRFIPCPVFRDYRNFESTLRRRPYRPKKIESANAFIFPGTALIVFHWPSSFKVMPLYSFLVIQLRKSLLSQFFPY
jgi:hypothetical protein